MWRLDGRTERGVVIDYLPAHWSSRAVSNGSPAPDVFAGNASVVMTDIIEQQRLGRAGWVREVDKMIRWGASVSETEKQALVDYLAARFAEAN